MNQREARSLMMKYLMPKIEKYGYKEKKGGVEWDIIRKTANGQDSIVGGFTDYNPIQKIIFSVSKRDARIINILKAVEQSGVRLSPAVSQETGTFGFSYGTLNGLSHHNYLPEMSTEAEVMLAVEMMVDFLERTAFPLLERFADLKEIDQEINGHVPWRTDWGMPYRFGGSFDVKRTIIAKLANNPHYTDLVDFIYTNSEALSAENGHPFVYDRNDLSKPLPAISKILEGVEPLAT